MLQYDLMTRKELIWNLAGDAPCPFNRMSYEYKRAWRKKERRYKREQAKREAKMERDRLELLKCEQKAKEEGQVQLGQAPKLERNLGPKPEPKVDPEVGPKPDKRVKVEYTEVDGVIVLD